MKIKYVGLKLDGETAFAREAGITAWMPGDSIEISNPGVAHRMLQHPDVFAVDEAETTSKKPAKGNETPPVAGGLTLAPGALVKAAKVDLDTMDKADLHALAKERGIKVHHAAGAETVRKALKAAQP